MLVPTLWLLNVLFDTAGQLAFKCAALNRGAARDSVRARWVRRLRDPWLWSGAVCFVAEFVLWLAFLSVVPLSRGVLLGSINIVAIMLAGRFLFGEKLTRLRVAGILLVTLGVAIVGVGG